MIDSTYSFDAASDDKIIVSVNPDKGFLETKYKFEYWTECPNSYALTGFFAKFTETKQMKIVSIAMLSCISIIICSGLFYCIYRMLQPKD